MVLEADRLVVERSGNTVLREVSVQIARGEVLSIVGPNGAGKSTLIAALAGLLPFRSGQVRLEGKPISSYRRRDIARRLAHVPQIYDGYLGFTARDMIEAGRYAHLDPLASLGEADRRAVDDAALACRIQPLLDRPIETLSGGERQKVWIAAVLAQQSHILLLDEPTTALDPAHQVDLVRILRQLAHSGHTLVVVCHDLNLPLALGGRVVALRQGEVFFDKPVAALRDPDRLHRLFGARFELHRGASDASTSIHLQWEGP